MKRAAEILNQAADLIDKGWCKGTYAALADGTPCSVSNPNAARFCLYGAKIRAQGDESEIPIGVHLDMKWAVDDQLGFFGKGPCGVEFNDEIAKDAGEVSALLRRAAARVAGASGSMPAILEHNSDLPHIVICGNPVDGFRYIGPFPSAVAAATYINTDPHLPDGDVWMAELDGPAP